MRNISFFLTTPQFLDGTKDVTRRLGWKSLKTGARLMAVKKGQGLKKGEKVKRLGEIEVLSVVREPLEAIGTYPDDCTREGFPELGPEDFVQMFCRHNRGCTRDTELARIEFRKVIQETTEGRKDAQ